MENTPICEKKILGNFSGNLGCGIPYRRNLALSRIFIINYKNNMKKVIKLTESELVSMVKKVLLEQGQVQDKLVQTSKSTSGDGKLKSITNTIGKTDSNSWFSYFPCLNGQPKSKKQIVNGNVVWKPNDSGQQFTLLPQSGKNDPLAKQAQQYKPVDGMIGQVKGGGIYYCSSEAYAKGFGPQIMTPTNEEK